MDMQTRPRSMSLCIVQTARSLAQSQKNRLKRRVAAASHRVSDLPAKAATNHWHPTPACKYTHNRPHLSPRMRSACKGGNKSPRLPRTHPSAVPTVHCVFRRVCDLPANAATITRRPGTHSTAMHTVNCILHRVCYLPPNAATNHAAPTCKTTRNQPHLWPRMRSARKHGGDKLPLVNCDRLPDPGQFLPHICASLQSD